MSAKRIILRKHWQIGKVCFVAFAATVGIGLMEQPCDGQEPGLQQRRETPEIVVDYRPAAGVTAIQIGWPWGDANTPELPAGSIHALEHLFFYGNQDQHERNLRSQIIAEGGESGAVTLPTTMRIWARIPSDSSEWLLRSLLEAWRFPALTQGNCDKEAELLEQEYRRLENSIHTIISQTLHGLAYSFSPWSLPLEYKRSDLSCLNPEILQLAYRKFLHPGQGVLAISGNLAPHRVQEICSEYIPFPTGNLTPDSAPPVAVEPPLRVGPIARDLPLAADYRELVLAFRTPGYRDPDAPIVDLISDLLGIIPAGLLYKQFASGKSPLALTTSCSLRFYRDHGFMTISMEPSAAVAPQKAVQKIIDLLSKRDKKLWNRGLFDAVDKRRRVEWLMSEEDSLNRVTNAVTKSIRGNDHGPFEPLPPPKANEIFRVADRIFRKDQLYFVFAHDRASPMAPEWHRELTEVMAPLADDSPSPSEPRQLDGIAPKQKTEMAPQAVSPISQFQLPNGITTILQTVIGSPLVHIGFYFPAGLIHEPDKRHGTAALANGLLAQARPINSNIDLEKFCSQIGARVEVNLTYDYAYLNFALLPEVLPKFLMYFRDLIAKPVIAEDGWRRQKDRLLFRIAKTNNNPHFKPLSALKKDLLGEENPYRLPLTGNAAQVETLRFTETQDFIRDHYRPSLMKIAVVSGLTQTELGLLLRPSLGLLEDLRECKDFATPWAPIRPSSDRQPSVQSSPFPLAIYLLGVNLPSTNHAGFWNGLLAAQTVAYRSFHSLTLEEGEVYQLDTSINIQKLANWMIWRFVLPSGTRAQCERIAARAERDVFTKEVSEEERQAILRWLSGKESLNLESNRNRALRLGRIAMNPMLPLAEQQWQQYLQAVDVHNLNLSLAEILHPAYRKLLVALPAED